MVSKKKTVPESTKWGEELGADENVLVAEMMEIFAEETCSVSGKFEASPVV